MTLYGGIEGGGTKFVCAVGTPGGEVLAETRYPTTSPEETLARAVDFFRGEVQALGPLAAIGIASFGPLDPRPGSPSFGRLLPTPKPGWTEADLLGPFRAAFGIPLGFDTDVNGAALGESRWGAGRGCDPVLYLTVGTGVGGGALVNGKLLHGLLHPEMGHIRIPHDKTRDPFEGDCPFHGDCFEGLASGPAVERRWGQKAETLPPSHPAWDLEAEYIALALASYICTLSPEKIIVGGGVARQAQLLPLVRRKVGAILNGYVQSPAILNGLDSYIVPPALGDRAGVLGAIALAAQMLE
ncbi:MAG: ROK family protein [Chloroflexota bacterium]